MDWGVEGRERVLMARCWSGQLALPFLVGADSIPYVFLNAMRGSAETGKLLWGRLICCGGSLRLDCDTGKIG